MRTRNPAPARGEAPMPATREGRHKIQGITQRRSAPMNGNGKQRLWPKPRGRWDGITRPYSQDDVARLQGTVKVEHSLARLGATRLWDLLNTQDYVAALGALTGNQAVQQIKAGLQAIYLSGWQVAADANLSGQTYPDQSLYPANSVPSVVRRINQALLRADQIEHAEGKSNGHSRHWMAPILADAEAGFGGPLNAFELMKGMIEAGAARGAPVKDAPPRKKGRAPGGGGVVARRCRYPTGRL